MSTTRPQVILGNGYNRYRFTGRTLSTQTIRLVPTANSFGFDVMYIPLITGTYTGNAGTTYTKDVDFKLHFAPAYVYPIRITWRVDWNPETTSGKLRLYNTNKATQLAEIAPGATGRRTDEVDILSEIDHDLTLFAFNHVIELQSAGDGTTAPTIYNSYIVIEY